MSQSSGRKEAAKGVRPNDDLKSCELRRQQRTYTCQRGRRQLTSL